MPFSPLGWGWGLCFVVKTGTPMRVFSLGAATLFGDGALLGRGVCSSNVSPHHYVIHVVDVLSFLSLWKRRHQLSPPLNTRILSITFLGVSPPPWDLSNVWGHFFPDYKGGSLRARFHGAFLVGFLCGVTIVRQGGARRSRWVWGRHFFVARAVLWWDGTSAANVTNARRLRRVTSSQGMPGLAMGFSLFSLSPLTFCREIEGGNWPHRFDPDPSTTN